MRRILRKSAAGDTSNLGDTSTLADPGVVEKLLEEKQGYRDTIVTHNCRMRIGNGLWA